MLLHADDQDRFLNLGQGLPRAGGRRITDNAAARVWVLLPQNLKVWLILKVKSVAAVLKRRFSLKSSAP